MLYIVGGCSRSGKSTLAERMRDGHGIPWFPLDALKMGLHLGAPSFGVHPDEDDLETADRMWPIVKGVLEHLMFDGRDHLIEGVNLRPQTVAAFIEQADEPVSACFLGYPEAAIEVKAIQVAQYAALPNDWLHRTGPDNVRRYLEVSKSLSRRLRADCAALGIPFFDTGVDFHAGVASAERALIGPAIDASH
jgi:predicted kinase